MDLCQRLVAPLDGDFLGLGLVALLHHHLDEFRLIQLGTDQNLLALLDIHAAADDQAGIFPQNGFFHGKNAPFVKLNLS